MDDREPERFPEVSCRFVQGNVDRRQIFAIADRERRSLGYGPLPIDKIWRPMYTARYPSRQGPQGDEALAADLMRRAEEFHDLEDFFRFYGYPPDVIDWIESTPLDDRPRPPHGLRPSTGREAPEVAERLGIDLQKLREAGWDESVIPGARDPAGDWVYQHGLGDNWAISDASGWLRINPNAYRFKAWLSLAD